MSLNERIKEAFDRIQADEELKRHTREFIFQKTQGYKICHSFPYKRAMTVMACFLFALLGLGYSIYFTTVSVISVDVNPSVELNINRFDKVIFAKTYNEDGDKLLSSVNIRFLDYKEALEQILEDKSIISYLTQDQLIAITVCGTNEKKKNEMLTSLTYCTASYGNIHCSSGSSEEVAAAHALGISFGKYKALLELQALDPTVTAEDIKGLTMRQIRDRITELSNGIEENTQNDNTNKGNGGQNCGHGNGKGNGNGCGSGNRQGAGNQYRN